MSLFEVVGVEVTVFGQDVWCGAFGGPSYLEFIWNLAERPLAVGLLGIISFS